MPVMVPLHSWRLAVGSQSDALLCCPLSYRTQRNIILWEEPWLGSGEPHPRGGCYPADPLARKLTTCQFTSQLWFLLLDKPSYPRHTSEVPCLVWLPEGGFLLGPNLHPPAMRIGLPFSLSASSPGQVTVDLQSVSLQWQGSCWG